MNTKIIYKIVGLLLFSLCLLVSCELFNPLNYNNSESNLPEGSFWALNLKTNKPYKVEAQLFYKGNHCIIYVDKALSGTGKSVSLDTAKAIADEYDNTIHGLVTGSFGEFKDVDDNGKVTFLLLDIQDGYDPKTSSGYTGGFFYSQDMYDADLYKYSNEADMLYLDVYPQVPNSSAFYSTMAHELQHLVEFSQTTSKGKSPKDIWLNEGLSTGAEYLYGKTINNIDPNRRVLTYLLSELAPSGNNFFCWDSSPTSNALVDYATVYLFFQWLRIHSDNGAGIYKNIINKNTSAGHSDVVAAINDNFGKYDAPSLDWETVLASWLLSNKNYQGKGLVGYGADSSFTEFLSTTMSGKSMSQLVPSYTVRRAINLRPGEGVFWDYNGLTNPENKGNIVYDKSLTNLLLAYNKNISLYGGQEGASLPPSAPFIPAPSVSASRSLEGSQSSELYEVLKDVPLDWKTLTSRKE
ncbi:MAG: hypothetical protein LBM77_07345 [Spirochaetaceae bacterium]|nr:hypothetical protein [Spirochaetaceae bacterium]